MHDLQISYAGAWLLIGWMFVLGAALGSFLNVVVYRLPRGMSLSTPGSQCPSCGHPIRWYDNVPIFGWLMLGGRCRDCRAAISPRYPLVELLAAAAAALVTWSEIAPVAGPAGVESFTVHPLLLGFRLLLVFTLLCAALLEFDGHPPPLRFLAVILIAGLVLSVPSAGTLVAAVLLGLLAWPVLIGDDDAIGGGAARVVELALAGGVLPLAVLAAVAVFSQALYLITRVAGRYWPPAARFGWAGAIVLGTLMWLAATGTIAARWLAMADEHGRTLFIVAGVIVALLSIVGRAAHRRRPIAAKHV
jgi:leader peptidase (prepilin peptidase) / N-methyltransferase